MTAVPLKIGVIVGRDLVGDALMKLPFLRALRNGFPAAEINWITTQGATAYASILRDVTQALIDQVHETPGWLNLGAHSVAPYFDILIDTRNRWRWALEARQLPHGLFLAQAARYLFSDRRPDWTRLTYARPPHMVDQMLQLVELAAGYRPPSTGGLPLSESQHEQPCRILPPGKVYIGLAPGAGNPIKIWPRFKFEKLAALQAAKGRVPVFILGPQELAAYDALHAAVPTAKFPLQDYNALETAQPGIDHTLAVASLLDVAVANDSGVGHMLAAVDCRLISLFGPTSPAKLAPRVSCGTIIRAQDFGSAAMKAITWEAVDAAVDEMLKR